MTDISQSPAMPARQSRPKQSILTASAEMKRRNAAEVRFKYYGIVAIVIALGSLAIMLFTIVRDGASSFHQAQLSFPMELTADVLDPKGNRNRDEMSKVTTVGYSKVLVTALQAELQKQGLVQEGVTDKEIGELISKDAAGTLRARVLADPSLVGTTITADVLAGGRIDGYLKGRVTLESAELDSNITPDQLRLADKLREAGILTTAWNWGFFTNPDASDQRPEASGLGVALLGSAYMMLLVLVTCVPVGVAASIYLEEFAPKNRWTDAIEVNISNLAAVPSIVFGILGLVIFINSIRDAALGIGASKMQTVFHHVLPLAMPGILTGTILGLASALGETAPLLLIGMVAFVDNYPSAPPEGFLDPATALPVQVYGWASRADPAFIERSNGAIIVLLVFLVIMNVAAILLRRRFERRW
jgi:phosphate transport system permease protein